MNTIYSNLINSISLIVLPLWAYATSITPSMTALIPTIIGAILLICTVGIKKENKNIAHIAVVLTLLALIGLVKPLIGAIDRVDNIAIIRVVIMIVTGIIAMITFIKSFIRNRKEKA
tara:strand:+ start:316 stop:666 length:351 start_codon:yes stop_codon:yes gene_type:complete